jgi:hypothetical protein
MIQVILHYQKKIHNSFVSPNSTQLANAKIVRPDIRGGQI